MICYTTRLLVHAITQIRYHIAPDLGMHFNFYLEVMKLVAKTQVKSRNKVNYAIIAPETSY